MRVVGKDRGGSFFRASSGGRLTHLQHPREFSLLFAATVPLASLTRQRMRSWPLGVSQEQRLRSVDIASTEKKGIQSVGWIRPFRPTSHHPTLS